jgi:hypothetical protein
MPNQSNQGIIYPQSTQNLPKMPVNLTSVPWRFAAVVLTGFILSAIVVSVVWTIGLLVLPLWSIDRTWLGVVSLSVLLTAAWAAIGLGWNRVAAHPWRFVTAQTVLGIAGLAWQPGEPLVAMAALSVASLLAAGISPFPVRGALMQWRQSWPRLPKSGPMARRSPVFP